MLMSERNHRKRRSRRCRMCEQGVLQGDGCVGDFARRARFEESVIGIRKVKEGKKGEMDLGFRFGPL